MQGDKMHDLIFWWILLSINLEELNISHYFIQVKSFKNQIVHLNEASSNS